MLLYLHQSFFMPLQHFINYIQTEKRQSTHTVKAYKSDLEQFSAFTEEVFSCNIQEATTPMLKAWISSLKSKRFDNSSINRKISALKVYYHFLHTNAFIKNNPAERINTLKAKKRVAVFVPKSDIEKNVVKIEENDFAQHRNYLIFELFYQTGIRAGEMIELHDSDIDFFGKTIKVIGKGNKQRIIPFGSELSKQIQNYVHLKNAMFPESIYFIVSNKGGKSYESMLYRIIRTMLSEFTTISKKSPHVLRHTFATHMLNNGASLIAIKELLGHSSLSATQIYTHNSIEQLKSIHKSAHPKGGA